MGRIGQPNGPRQRGAGGGEGALHKIRIHVLCKVSELVVGELHGFSKVFVFCCFVTLLVKSCRNPNLFINPLHLLRRSSENFEVLVQYS